MLRSPRWQATLGDFDLGLRQGEYVDYRRTVDGVQAGYDDGRSRVRAHGATSRGRFRRQELAGREGVQGPYQLLSEQGSDQIVVLAGTAILAVSLVVWVLSNFPGDQIEDSILGVVGRGLEPAGRLVGFDWQMIVALMTSFVAKENTIATLGVVLGTGEGDVNLSTQLTQVMVPAAAVAFIAVQMLFVPCVASVAAIRRETQSWRWTGFAIGYMLGISLAVGVIIYQVARLMGWGV